MPRHEVRTSLNFRQTINDRVGTKAAVVALTAAGTELWRLEQGERVPVDLLHSLWTSPGQFYATGHVEVDARWQVARWPLTEEAKGIEKALGLSVYAAYSRGDGPNPFPAPPEPEPVPEPPPRYGVQVMGWQAPLGLVEQSLAGLEPLGGAWRERGPTLTFLRASQHYTGVGHMVEGPILSGGSSRLERLVLLFKTR